MHQSMLKTACGPWHANALDMEAPKRVFGLSSTANMSQASSCKMV